MKPLLSDDFQKDSRSKYTIKGDVAWQPGRLQLSTGSSIARKLTAGWWVQLKFELGWGSLEKDGDRSITVLEFDLKKATDCLVVWNLSRSQGQVVGRVRIFDTAPKDGKVKRRLVRESTIHSRADDWTVTYRYGLLKVATPNQPGVTGHIENGPATVLSCRVFPSDGESVLTNLQISGSRFPRALTDDEMTQLATARKLGVQAVRLYREGKAKQALPMGRQSLKIRKRILGDRHPSYAESLNNLAVLYKSMGEYVRAEPLYRQALAINKAVLGEKHPHYATSLNDLASLYQSKGEYARAEPLYRQASAIYKAVLGAKHPHYVISLNNLAALYPSMGEYARAEPLFRRALEMRKAALGEKHPDYPQSLNNLAVLYQSMGAYTRAEPLYHEARDIFKKALGKEHPKYATSLNNLAGLYVSTGEYLKAAPLFAEAFNVLLNSAEIALPSFSEAQAIAWLARHRQGLDLILSNARAFGTREPREVYRSLWQSRSLIWRLLGTRRLSVDASNDVRAVYSELQRSRKRLADLVLAVPPAGRLDEHQKQVMEWGDKPG